MVKTFQQFCNEAFTIPNPKDVVNKSKKKKKIKYSSSMGIPSIDDMKNIKVPKYQGGTIPIP
jgi:AAA+ ATPase superfamily predicted ATPase